MHLFVASVAALAVAPYVWLVVTMMSSGANFSDFKIILTPVVVLSK